MTEETVKQPARILMAPVYILLSSLLLTTSCSFSKWWPTDSKNSARTIASSNFSELMYAENERFSSQLEEKLFALHSYYTIGQLNLHQFDRKIAEESLEEVYSSKEYHNLQAARAQIDELEEELHSVFVEVNRKKGTDFFFKSREMKEKISRYNSKSKMASLSMQNLMYKMELTGQETLNTPDIKLKDITSEYNTIENRPAFLVYENNIEHLSNSLSFETKNRTKRFFSSVGKEGNISGNEFPSKVWALTFDDGPGKSTTQKILKELEGSGIKATFFQLTEQVKNLSSVARQVKEAGMEIASHSYTHQQLTKVNSSGLETEITTASNELSKIHGVEIKYYRLPYGAGMNKPAIRQKLVDNDLIHIFWNIDSLDWMPQTPEKIVNRVKAQMLKTKKDAGVLLFHDIHARTAQATPKILNFLKRDDRRVCTIGEIVNQMNEGVKTVCPKKSRSQY